MHILLMDNLFLHVRNKISEFDLKGSMINREIMPPFTMKDCLKDKNLLRHSRTEPFLKFRQGDMRSICERILRDIGFMAEHNLMDYSLLLITEENPDYFNTMAAKKLDASAKSQQRVKVKSCLGNNND